MGDYSPLKSMLYRRKLRGYSKFSVLAKIVLEVMPKSHLDWKALNCAFSRNSAGLLNLFFQFVAGMKGHHSPCIDGNRFARAWVASGARRFCANLKVAKP